MFVDRQASVPWPTLFSEPMKKFPAWSDRICGSDATFHFVVDPDGGGGSGAWTNEPPPFSDWRMPGEGFDDGYQSVPVNWGISSPRKKAFFGLLKEITGNPG